MSYQPPPLELWNWLGPVGQDFVSRVNWVLSHGLVSRVNDWYRDEATNAMRGGKEMSQHLFALAVDLQTGAYTSEVVAAAERAGLRPVPFASGTAVHVQYYPAGRLASWGIRPGSWRASRYA